MNAKKLVGGAAVIVLLASVLLWRWLSPSGSTPPARAAQSAAPQEPTRVPAAAAPRPAASAGAEARRARDAAREQILEALRKRDAGAAIAPPPSPSPPPASPGAATPPAGDPAARGHYDVEYIQEHFREDMFPLLRQCYESALAQRPALSGKLVLTFTIVGDPSVGGVVEDADFAEESDLKDPEMETCVRESLMTLIFDKPPEGGGFVTVKYPVLFSPGDEDAGAEAGAGAR